VATRGLDDTGGLDVDAAIVQYLGTVYAVRHPDPWRRLVAPVTAADLRASRQLWHDVRVSKESLSRLSSSVVPVPLLDADAPIGRPQLDDLAAPVVARTVAATEAVLRDAGIAPADLAGVFLVGGSSRLPLAATLLHRTLQVPPMVIEQPELAVAEGSLLAPVHPPHTTFTDLPAAPPPDHRAVDQRTALPAVRPTLTAPPTEPLTPPSIRPGRRPSTALTRNRAPLGWAGDARSSLPVPPWAPSQRSCSPATGRAIREPRGQRA
jgi:hypothetical protein